MTDEDYARKLDELDRLLNDATVPIEPALFWRLLDEVSMQAAPDGVSPEPSVRVAAGRPQSQPAASIGTGARTNGNCA